MKMSAMPNASFERFLSFHYLDINECTVNRPCDPDHGVCRNLPGTYRCLCQIGYELIRQGVNCTGTGHCNISFVYIFLSFV